MLPLITTDSPCSLQKTLISFPGSYTHTCTHTRPSLPHGLTVGTRETRSLYLFSSWLFHALPPNGFPIVTLVTEHNFQLSLLYYFFSQEHVI